MSLHRMMNRAASGVGAGEFVLHATQDFIYSSDGHWEDLASLENYPGYDWREHVGATDSDWHTRTGGGQTWGYATPDPYGKWAIALYDYDYRPGENIKVEVDVWVETGVTYNVLGAVIGDSTDKTGTEWGRDSFEGYAAIQWINGSMSDVDFELYEYHGDGTRTRIEQVQGLSMSGETTYTVTLEKVGSTITATWNGEELTHDATTPLDCGYGGIFGYGETNNTKNRIYEYREYAWQ